MDALRYTSPTRGVNKASIDNTPKELARQCLAEAHNNPQRAISLAGKRAHGARLRAVVMAIGDALLRGATA
jgi:hypothetical protein